MARRCWRTSSPVSLVLGTPWIGARCRRSGRGKSVARVELHFRPFIACRRGTAPRRTRSNAAPARVVAPGADSSHDLAVGLQHEQASTDASPPLRDRDHTKRIALNRERRGTGVAESSIASRSTSWSGLAASGPIAKRPSAPAIHGLANIARFGPVRQQVIAAVTVRDEYVVTHDHPPQEPRAAAEAGTVCPTPRCRLCARPRQIVATLSGRECRCDLLRTKVSSGRRQSLRARVLVRELFSGEAQRSV
jgi:hypothetical protein